MGGKILEYEAKTIWRDGQSKGRISTYLNMRRNGIPQKSAQAMAELTDQQAQEAEHQLKETSSN